MSNMLTYLLLFESLNFVDVIPAPLPGRLVANLEDSLLFFLGRVTLQEVNCH